MSIRKKYKCQEDVLRRLLQREHEGLSLRVMTVRRDERPLYDASVHYFRSWRDALRAAGMDHESITARRKWTKKRLLQRIRALERQGIAMNLSSVQQVDSSLTGVACRFWGSWDEALVAVGFDATSIRRHRPPWTEQEVINAIQIRAVEGCCMMKSAMQPISLGKAAERLFGSFYAALEAAGVLENCNLPPKQWSRAKVEAAIQNRIRHGKPINSNAVFKTDQSLSFAARYTHGGWNQALRAVGIDPDCVRLACRPWTKDSVLKELRRRVAEGIEPTHISEIQPVSLVVACRKLFGSCKAAAIEAGVDPAKISIYYAQHNGRNSLSKRGRTRGQAR